MSNLSVPYDQYFRRHFAPKELLLAPKTYDIVLYQNQDSPMAVQHGSLFVTPVLPPSELQDKVLWYLGQPDDFYLELEFVSKTMPRSPIGLELDWDAVTSSSEMPGHVGDSPLDISI